MTISEILTLGIVEGITEFLPISSTFHLLWTSQLLGIQQTEFQKLFEVAIQSGAILAVLIPFIKAIKQDILILKKVIVAFIPTAVIGFLLYPVIKNIFFNNTQLQLIVFAAVGIIFIAFEYMRKNPLTRNIEAITYKEAALVGTIQALAIFPGVSRAGAVIVALMALSYKREDAARFSFFLAVPTILSASLFDLIKSNQAIQTQSDALSLLLGFLAAFLTALIVVRWLMKYLTHHTISAFGWYRIITTLLILSFWV